MIAVVSPGWQLAFYLAAVAGFLIATGVAWAEHDWWGVLIAVGFACAFAVPLGNAWDAL